MFNQRRNIRPGAQRGQLIESATQEEMAAVVASRARLGDRLVESWSKTREGVKLDELYTENPAKARNTAIAMEMQKQYLKESLHSSDFPTTPENTLRIVRIGVANSNRSDVYTEWQLTSTNDVFFFVDKTFGDSLRSATSGQRIYEGIAPQHPTEMGNYDGGGWTGNAVLTTFAGTIPITPVVIFSVKVLVSETSGAGATAGNGAYVGVDDGSGGFSTINSVLDTTSSTINYTTGAISLVFNTAPASGAKISVDYQWDSEQSANFAQYGTVGISVTKKQFNPRPQPLGYEYSSMVKLTLGSTGLGDADDILVRAVGDEHAMQRDYRAFRWHKRLALSNTVATFDTDFAAAGEDNDYNHAQRVLTAINDISGTIYDTYKRGVINVGVAGSKALSYLKKHKNWSPDTTQARVGGSYLAGRLDDIAIYHAPSDATMAATDEVLLTWKNPDEDGEAPLVFGVLAELVASLDYPQFYTVGNVAVVEDCIPNVPGFCRLLRLENL